MRMSFATGRRILVGNQPMTSLAPGVGLARGAPARPLNIYLLGDVVVDSGWRWSRSWLRRALAGRRVTGHALTHAHFDHAGSAAWLCRTLDIPLWCGAGDAEAMSTGQVATHGSAWLNRAQQALLPVDAHPVRRALREGDLVGGFEVLEAPGHTDGSLDSGGSEIECWFWRRTGELRAAPRSPTPGTVTGQTIDQPRPELRLRTTPYRVTSPTRVLRSRLRTIDDPGRFADEANRLLESPDAAERPH